MKNKVLATTIAATLLTATGASAEAVRSSFFTNDYIGDGHDRWRSGSYTMNWAYEEDKVGVPFDLRFRSEIISPWGSNKQATNNDRLYVGALGLGAFANQKFGFTDVTYGGEILAVGDQTGVAAFQGAAHDLLGLSNSYNPDEQPHEHLADAFTGMISGEVAANYFMGATSVVRPYVAAQYGYETYLRAGADVVIGNMSNGERWMRDPVSGFIQPSGKDKGSALQGYSLVAGFDVTTVTDSAFFPNHSDVELEPLRMRARLGGQVGVGGFSVFYGMTHLTKEFTSQYESQTVGTISIETTF